MTKLELMDYCWSRDFNYDELLHVASLESFTEAPTREEYREYGKQAFEGMLRYMDRQYEDWRTPEQRAKQELGIVVGDCER